MVSFLLERGADIRARNEGTGWTALHAAAFQEHGKAVRVLLDRGADPKVTDTEGRSPIDYASISEAIWPFFAGTARVLASTWRHETSCICSFVCEREESHELMS